MDWSDINWLKVAAGAAGYLTSALLLAIFLGKMFKRAGS